MIKIIDQKDVPLLSRKRINLDLSYVGATPKKETVKKEVADFLKTKQDLVVLRHIYSRFGEESAKVIVHVYKNLEDLEKIEEIKKKVKPSKKKTEETKKPGVVKPEKKTEEKVEEKPKEEKNGKEESKEQKTK